MSISTFSKLRGSFLVPALSALALLSTGPVQAKWPQGIADAEVIRTIPTSSGDLIVAGHFSGEAVFGNTVLNSSGLQDVFVARLSPSGEVVWAASGGGAQTDTVNGITLDSSNNVYLAGSTYGNVQFGGVSNNGNSSNLDGYVARLNANGQWAWVNRISGSGADRATDLVVYPGDTTVIPPVPATLIVTGGYAASATFQASQTSVGLTGAPHDDFLAKLTLDGKAWVWAVNRPGGGSSELGKRLLLDNQLRLHMLGEETMTNVDVINQTFNAGSTNLATDWDIDTSYGGRVHIISNAHRALVDPVLAGNDSIGLAFNAGGASITRKVAVDAGSAAVLTVSMVLNRGDTVPAPVGGIVSGGHTYGGYVSEQPDWTGYEDLVVEFLARDGTWRRLTTFSAGGTYGERIDYSQTFTDDPQLFHPNLKFRIRQLGGSGGEFDWWFVSSFKVSIPPKQAFLHSISNLGSNSAPDWNQLIRFPGSTNLNDATLYMEGGQARVALVGAFNGSVTAPQTACPTYTGASGGFIAIFKPNGPNYDCEIVSGLSGASAQGVGSDNTRVFVTGGFAGSLSLGSTTITANTGGSDVYIAAMNIGTKSWDWLTGGLPPTPTTPPTPNNPPAAAGGPGEDVGMTLTVAMGAQLYVGGRFQGIAHFGPIDELTAQGTTDGFVVKLGTDGRFFQPEIWRVGVAITPPVGALTNSLTMQPEIYYQGQLIQATGNDYRWFTWVYEPSKGGRLIPLQPTDEVEVRWRTSPTPENPARVVTLGAAAWPVAACGDFDVPGDNVAEGCYQSHVVGAPVEAKPSQYQIVGEVLNPSSNSSGATLSGGVFNATRSGYAVITYVLGPSVDQSQYPTYIEVVRSLPYQMTQGFQDNVSVEIGKKITNTSHNEPSRTGWVLNELAYYDGSGVNAAYNRQSRQGTIIPVNRYSASRPQDFGRELAVAWYRRNGKGVYWASRAVRYAPRWPYDPDRIVIASEKGSEVNGQAVLTAGDFPQASIYQQNDYSAPGYNPNDEHALMAPSSTGSGSDAVFALRSDFGGDNDKSAASDPYVLLKYYNNTDSEWNFKLYKVVATDPQYANFRYTGVAGTTVSPPYPVRLLPGCAQSFVDGQATGEPPPPPFFQDHKNQLWAKSAGSGRVYYYYPMQPGFYQDNNADDANDYPVGQCTPWLARLPESQGGSPSMLDPIAVSYDIAWPDSVPLLIAGETLLTPKRGLPDITNQAAVQIVYDQQQETLANAEPKDTLAQLIDPLGSRWVRLSQIPAEIASEQRTDGYKDIVGSSDGTRKMPASLGERIYYDPNSKRLIFIGVFDETGAGEPKLLLNVISKRERVLLKRLNGGDGNEQSTYEGDCVSSGGCTWDQAIEALYRQTRNPSGIDKICRASVLDENRHRNCTNMDLDPSPDELLIAYTDPANDGILQPMTQVGGGAALTAGAATGSGYVTLAFNNDASLGALPVSLEVIKVGCLESNATTPPILAPYQGQINVISPDNLFDEQLVLRHSGDFGGNPDALAFEWYFHPDANGTPPMPLPDPSTGQMHGWIQFPVANPNGAVEISIEGANIQTLSDNWYLARYRGLSVCGNTSNWSLWAGQPGGTPVEPRAQLAEGWVKRVLARLNPFEARVQDFGSADTNAYVSMLIQLGERYSGPIALNDDPGNLNSIGLIEAYTTVMRRALSLSAGATPPIDYGPANAAILLVASRISDFYTLLGNEAYADAQDPTIAVDTNDGSYMSMAPSIFNFQNQLPSLLDEELALLRGRDDSHGPVAASPVYNRLFWNFTRNDGEVAYALSYNIGDQDVNGIIDEYDARIQFPQGHGDAWGHYLTAMTTYYGLLRHPYFSWNPQSEAVGVAGVPINVDYLDERQFATTAVAKARTGVEIVDLTYRSAYTENPDGQWQGYDDTNPDRAWGLSEWGRRAGMGAYFDWVTANAIVPEIDPNPAHVGIQRIERKSLSELNQIASTFTAIQGKVDRADAGLNPLGLAKGVVPFDIDPSMLMPIPGIPTKTQFEQVWDRAMSAMNNAVKMWDYANQLNNQLRRAQDSADDMWDMTIDEENSFSNDLIEIFGYPYADDIGGSGTYPDGYDGPDLYHYMYMDAPALAGTAFDFDTPVTDNLAVTKIDRFDGYYRPAANGVGFFNTSRGEDLGGVAPGDCATSPMAAGCALGDPKDDLLKVEYVTMDSPLTGFLFTKPPEWTGVRRAPGRLQQVLQEMLLAQISLKQGILEYDAMRHELEAKIRTLRATFNTASSNIAIANEQRKTLLGLTIASQIMANGAIVARRVGEFFDFNFKTTGECIPKNMVAGLAVGGDLWSGPRCVVQAAGSVGKLVSDTIGDGLEIAGNAIEASKEDVTELASIRSMVNDSNLELYNIAGEIDEIMRKEPMLRSEIFARGETIKQLQGEYAATLAEGMRVFERLVMFRRNTAAETQNSRYRDMAFRIFRNDALQKYQDAFELAARYVYLAASAYDYETNLMSGDSRSGQGFLNNIVKQRSLGQVLSGTPMAGTAGLADTMAQLKLNFDVLKGQMGFNNPQLQTNGFSLRKELFRIGSDAEGDEAWQRKLDAARVADLWQLPEYRRLTRPFAPEAAGPQPGLVFEFSTNVTSGLNFFGWDLGANDSSYNASRFATRIRAAGVWFGNYVDLPLADDPKVYLIPVGADVLRSPDPLDFSVREWQVIDQAIPVPLPIGTADMERYDWTPQDTLSESRVNIRRYPMMDAFHYSGVVKDDEMTGDSRLVGRSVWNRKWLLIIPGNTLLADSNKGLDTLIHGAEVPGGGGVRDGHGIDDIRLSFKTYSYSGN